MFSSSTIRRAALGVMAVPLLIGIQGCRDQDAIAAAGAIAVVGGAIAISNSYDNGYGYNDGRYYRDGRYNRGYQRPPPYRGGRGGWHRTALDTSADYSHEEQQVEELNSAALMASHYNISITAAKTLKNSLNETVQAQSLQPLYELGLSKDDLQSLSQAQGVSPDAINRLSTKLNLTREQTQVLVQQMTTDVLNSNL